MTDWHEIYITDKSDKKMFKCIASPMSTKSEINNLKQHLAHAKVNPRLYKFLDLKTAVIMLDGEPYHFVEKQAIDADALLAELGI
jgi:hypothetical protein